MILSIISFTNQDTLVGSTLDVGGWLRVCVVFQSQKKSNFHVFFRIA